MRVRVSVVMPVRDARAYVAEAVDSVLRQTLDDLELICIDDGSRDGTAEELARFAAGDARVRVITQPARGLVPALNRGLELARAPFVARMDADDASLPDRLARQVDALERQPRVAALGCAAQVFTDAGASGRVLRFPERDAEIRARLDSFTCAIHHPTVVFRRAALVAVGGYRPQFPVGEDFDLFVRLSERHELGNLPDVLYRYRLHGPQVVFRRIEQQVLSILGAIESSRARARGDADPIARLEGPVTWAFLRELGLAPDRISREVAAAHGGAVRELLQVGLVDEASRVADDLSTLTRDGVVVGRDARVEQYLAECHLERARGRPLRATRALARALMLRPADMGLRLARAVARRLRARP